jgi:acyl-coenzyme A thioesterase PaaI-like protein
MTSEPSLQERYAPLSVCYGCGPANAQGLHIRSFAQEDGKLICDWTPAPHHHAFPGVLNGGIIGSLLDCHCNWTAAYHLMRAAQVEQLPSTVTADYRIKLMRPTPMGTLRLTAWPTQIEGDRAVIEGTLEAGGKICATCQATFVAVKPGHPAYHRW